MDVVTSWDFFDTLLGRRTGAHPWRLFDHVAGEEYRKVRQLAEARSDKTWAGIWQAMAELTGWPADRLRELEAREWAAERAAAFPIVENVRRVRPGDRIVSDCYFSEAQVRELADAIGIPRSVEIVVSWDGKWTGRWWQTPEARSAGVHVGDNPRSDYSKARAAGLQAELYAGSRMTADEAELDKAGRWEVAAAMRAARLSNAVNPATQAFEHWNTAAAVNVRFLLLAAGLVRQYVEAAKPKRVCFVSRDTLLLQQAYAALWSDLEVETFWASRETLRKPSESFTEYARSLAAGTLFVDLHGTGRTVRQFADATGVDLAYVFVLGQRRLPAVYHRLVNLNGISTGTAAEVMNYDTAGRVIDVVDGLPVRAAVEYDTAIVQVHRAASLAGVQACCHPLANVQPIEVERAAEAIRSRLCRELLRQHQAQHPEARPTATVAPVVRRGIRR